MAPTSLQMHVVSIVTRIVILWHCLQVRLAKGVTGYIAFNENGTRNDYTLSLYNHGGKELYNKVRLDRLNALLIINTYKRSR